MRQIILASTSPRHREMFKLLKIKHKALDSGYKEVIHKGLSHKELVMFLAMGKARAAAKKYPRAIIIAADTMISFKGKIIGKPKNKQQAGAMLKSFSGRAQSLVTGVVVMDAASKQAITACVMSKIYFKKLSNRAILEYIKIGNPYDKAGGYNLQGPGLKLIKRISGDFTNNLGLPMGVVFNALQELGVST